MYLREIVITIAALSVLGCSEGAPDRRVASSYDEFTRQLQALYADQDGDGRADQWTYFDGSHVLRGEKDVDGDGRVDRWEYFDREGRLIRVGTSSVNDGIEDTWAWMAESGADGRIDLSRRRDRQIDRHEYFKAGTLVRAEEDSNADGKIDRWDRYDGKVLRQVDFDTTLSHERPDRRAIYNASGAFERVESDPEFDGVFVTVSGAAPDLKDGLRR